MEDNKSFGEGELKAAYGLSWTLPALNACPNFKRLHFASRRINKLSGGTGSVSGAVKMLDFLIQ